MITVYAIIASLLLGAFIRHNFHEMRTSYRVHRLEKKIGKEMARKSKKAEEDASKLKEVPTA